jgi:hypothetical protein
VVAVDTTTTGRLVVVAAGVVVAVKATPAAVVLVVLLTSAVELVEEHAPQAMHFVHLHFVLQSFELFGHQSRHSMAWSFLS